MKSQAQFFALILCQFYLYIGVPIRLKKPRSKLKIPDDFKNQVEYVNKAYIGSQFDTLQIFAMKKTNISEKDHKEWAELDFILIHSSRKCEEKTTRFSNVIFHRICPLWNWEVNEVRNNEHRISNLKNNHSFEVLHIHSTDQNFWTAWRGVNLYDYHVFQLKTAPAHTLSSLFL